MWVPPKEKEKNKSNKPLDQTENDGEELGKEIFFKILFF